MSYNKILILLHGAATSRDGIKSNNVLCTWNKLFGRNKEMNESSNFAAW